MTGVLATPLSADFDPVVVRTRWPTTLAEVACPHAVDRAIVGGAGERFPPPDDAVRLAVRDLLRAGGYAPSGRNKPCSEYIRAAADAGRFPRIDVAVDVGNAVALHSGLPTGVLDAARLTGGLRFGVAASGSSYVFNASGQELALGGLLCLHDEAGACASPVKDPQRSKTLPGTTVTLTVVYGTRRLAGRAAQAADWVEALHAAAGGIVERLKVSADGVVG